MVRKVFSRKRSRWIVGCAASVCSAMLGTAIPASAGVVIVGGLSNFDCPNNTGTPENEFEIELPSVDPLQIASYWANTPAYKGSGYGQPTQALRASSDGVLGHSSTYVDYLKTGVQTPSGFTEHFGIHFKNPNFMPASTIYSWKNAGVAYKFGLPTMNVTSTPNLTGGTTVNPVVTNTTPNPLIVQVREGPTMSHPNGVQLGDLVDTNPEIQIVEAEPEPGSNGLTGVLLRPGQALGIDGEAHDITDPIIVDRVAWITAHPLEPVMNGVDLNNAGEAALTTMSVFAVDANNARGALIANVFSAVNTAPVPEPSTALLAVFVLTGMVHRSRRFAKIGTVR